MDAGRWIIIIIFFFFIKDFEAGESNDDWGQRNHNQFNYFLLNLSKN